MARTSSSTSQMSQLASTVNKLESKGKLPSQSEVANVSAFTPCTGKVVDTPSSNNTLHKFSNPFLVKKDKVYYWCACVRGHTGDLAIASCLSGRACPWRYEMSYDCFLLNRRVWLVPSALASVKTGRAAIDPHLVEGLAPLTIKAHCSGIKLSPRLLHIDVSRTKFEFEWSQLIDSCIGTSCDGSAASRWPLSISIHLRVDDEPHSPRCFPPQHLRLLLQPTSSALTLSDAMHLVA
ncbi:retrotransposon gag protein [Cucumis melo var. makuwa]|uniref:Retrotransposon gag protein n=1 Tax=Cucumis melo var. makuwa TaxID=1194695 RepID=A0A5A7TKJ9_CUCMM|nr:retrotransposon gag protein [Cucumis melo var. makuwa]